MNIAIVLMRYNPFGGYERQAALLAKSLVARGDKVTVFASGWKEDGEEGITFHKVPVLRLASWLKVLTFAYFSKRRVLAMKDSLDVVIAFDRTFVMDIYRAGNACHREWQEFRRSHDGLPGRVSMAVNPLHRVINFIEGRLFSRIKAEGGRVVVLSETGMEQITRNYPVPKDRFTLIPPAIDLSRFRPEEADREEARKALGLAPETLVLLHVGSGFRIKGLSSTIRALSIITRKGVDAVLLAAGSDKKETPGLKQLSKELGIEDRVKFLGGVKDVGRLYAASDVFVLPSLFETFGVAAVEALYAGLPVVIGKGAGAHTMIEQAGAGRAIDVSEGPERLAGAIMDVFKDELRLKSVGKLDGEKARRRNIALEYGVDDIMKRFLSVIDRVAEEKSKRRLS